MAKYHKCLKKLDEELEKTNTRLVANILNQNHVFIDTERIRKLRDGKKATTVIATYCPFCGEKLKGT